GACGLAHPELDTLGPDAVTAPALRARRAAGEPRGRLLDLQEEVGARGDGPALLAGGRRMARLDGAREPVGVGIGVRCSRHRPLVAPGSQRLYTTRRGAP